MKKLERLIPDIYEVIKGNGGWTPTITKFFSEELSKVAESKFVEAQQPRDYLSLSSLGTPCRRKLWYRINNPNVAAPPSAESLGNFFYGDLLETFLLTLAKASGHQVEGEQEEVEINGVKGHVDAIIDGVVVDIKSASKYGFEKFQNNNLRNEDSFGYISQLSSYCYALKDDPRILNPNTGAFLAVKKDRFKLALDVYNLSEEIKNKSDEVDKAKELVKQKTPPKRLDPVPQFPKKDNGNRVIPFTCDWCEFKKTCWGNDVRKFIYSDGVRWLTHVEKEPRVKELVD